MVSSDGDINVYMPLKPVHSINKDDSKVYYDKFFWQNIYPDLLDQLIEEGILKEQEIVELSDGGDSYLYDVVYFDGYLNNAFFLFTYKAFITHTWM